MMIPSPLAVRFRSPRRRAALAAATLSVCGSLPAADATNLVPVWDAVTRYNPAEAERAWTAVAGDADALPPPVAFARAILLLNQQPSTAANLRTADELFTQVHATTPDPDLRVAARYYRARLAQLNPYGPDEAGAHDAYWSLYLDAPAHPLAQMGLVKAALLALYNAPDEASLHAAFARLEDVGPRLTDRAARRDFHYTLGFAYHRTGVSAERALAHLMAVEEIGLLNRNESSNLLLQIGDIAARLERWDIMRTYFQKHLALFPRDEARALVEDRLAAAPPPAPAP